MVRCQMAPSHYLNQCWLTSEITWHSFQDKVYLNTFSKLCLNFTHSKLQSHLPGDNELTARQHWSCLACKCNTSCSPRTCYRHYHNTACHGSYGHLCLSRLKPDHNGRAIRDDWWFDQVSYGAFGEGEKKSRWQSINTYMTRYSCPQIEFWGRRKNDGEKALTLTPKGTYVIKLK